MVYIPTVVGTQFCPMQLSTPHPLLQKFCCMTPTGQERTATSMSTWKQKHGGSLSPVRIPRTIQMHGLVAHKTWTSHLCPHAREHARFVVMAPRSQKQQCLSVQAILTGRWRPTVELSLPLIQLERTELQYCLSKVQSSEIHMTT